MTDKRESVYSIDVTDGGLGVSCSTDGSLLVWTTNEGLIRVTTIKLSDFIKLKIS